MTNKKPAIKTGNGLNATAKSSIPAPSAEPTPVELAEVVEDPTLMVDLDGDPNTSLVGSLSLHMLSEHGIGGSVHLDETALTSAHQQAHRDTGQAHAIADIRFRPQRALDAAMLACESAVATPAPM